jgi:hypothetical protein
MTLLADRFISDGELESRASELLRRYTLRWGRALTPPIPVDKVIEQALEIPIVWEPIPDQAGRPVLAKLVIKRSGLKILVNEDKLDFFEQHSGVEAYSLAHEAGHFVFHVDKASLQTELLADDQQREIVLCRGPVDDEGKRRERQAERFAAFLLMPRDLLQQACASANVYEWRALYQLRDQFGVSITALTNRLKDLRLITITADGHIRPYQDPTTAGQPTLWR